MITSSKDDAHKKLIPRQLRKKSIASSSTSTSTKRGLLRDNEATPPLGKDKDNEMTPPLVDLTEMECTPPTPSLGEGTPETTPEPYDFVKSKAAKSRKKALGYRILVKTPRTESQLPCQFYEATRMCRFGDKCRFSHG